MAALEVQNNEASKAAKYSERKRVNDTLWYAARDGNADVISRLIDAGADPNYYLDDTHNTPLCIATINGHTDVVRMLIIVPAVSIDWRNNDNQTAFHLASENNRVEIINLLVDNYINPTTIDILVVLNKQGYNLLHLAAIHGHVAVVDRLLSLPDRLFNYVNELSLKYESALSLAAQNGHVDVVDRLLADPSIGPSINGRDRAGNTPLKLAAINEHLEIVKHLLAKGAQPMYHIQKSIHLHPDIIQAMNDVKRKQFEIFIPPFIPIHVGDKIKVPFEIHSTSYRTMPIEPNCTVVEVGPCRWEITESKLTEFIKFINDIETSDPELKEVLHYLYPSIYSMEGPISKLSDINTFRHKGALLELMRTLNATDMDIEYRRVKLIEISRFPEYDLRMLQLVEEAYNIIKRSQVIKVEFIDHPGVFAYYVAHNCSQAESMNDRDIHFIAEDYLDTESSRNNNNGNNNKNIDDIIPTYHGESGLKSVLPSRYSLAEITEINSWITHGLLSLYLMKPDIVKAVCTNPLVGNEELWRYVQDMMETQFTILHGAARPLDSEIQVYRGSPYFQPYAVRRRSIFATSKYATIANGFHKHAKMITIPRGTRVLDLSEINRDEQEILVFPSARDVNMVIEPVNIGKPNKRNTYRIRNVENRNRNTPRSRRFHSRKRKHTNMK